jgi:6,7-dimethyl-8-ribityllumazine synthase
MSTVIRGSMDGSGRRVAVAVARFNDLVTDRLLRGAIDTLVSHGVRDDHITVVWVPGAFELPLCCRWLAARDDIDAVVALGAVIRGSTGHYEHVCAQAARGILDASIATDKPVAFGVLTCESLEQALERAGSKAGNKGADAALCALEMLGVRRALDGAP